MADARAEPGAAPLAALYDVLDSAACDFERSAGVALIRPPIAASVRAIGADFISYEYPKLSFFIRFLRFLQIKRQFRQLLQLRNAIARNQ